MLTDEEIENLCGTLRIYSDVTASADCRVALEKLRLQALFANKLDRLLNKHILQKPEAS